MIVLLSGITGNVSSIVMWIPGAIVIWKNRNDVQALKGVNLVMQSIAIINTLSWGINGLSTHNYNLAFGTLFILPTILFSIILKIKSKR
jgi:uncharacterized protein with PQ loop repeat